MASATGSTPAGRDLLRLLEEGNLRFRTGRPMATMPVLSALEQGQHPFAVVLGCADSRVCPEIIFDCALGELFVVRIAGNFATPAVIGSIEYAVHTLGTRLVVTLGHDSCGGVAAALQHGDGQKTTEYIDSIARGILPAVRRIPDQGDRWNEAMRANVRHTVDALRHTPSLQSLVDRGELLITGAEYHLGTGVVTFLDRPSD